jgi:creatinase
MRAADAKSPAEIALIRAGAAVADVGGYAIREAMREGVREIDVAMAGRDAMERRSRALSGCRISRHLGLVPVGPNTDGAHNPVTARVLERATSCRLNTFPMISGYYTALERTLFVGEVDDASLAVWEANVAAHEWA